MSKLPFGFNSPEDSPGFLLWQATTMWQRQIKRVLEEFNISHAQFVIMALLLWFKGQKQEVTQVDIATRSRLDKMTVSKSLKKLVEMGFAKREEHSEDTRAKSVFITAKGVRLLHKVVPLVEEADQIFFGLLKKKEIKELRNYFKILSQD